MTGRNRAAVTSLFDAASAGDLEAVAACYADDFVDHACGGSRAGTDKEAAIRTFRELLMAFPDTVHTVEDVIAEGDRVVVRLHAVGTHTGTFRGVAPTGRRVSMRSTAIYRLRDGRLVERWCDSVASVVEAIGEQAVSTASEIRLLRSHEEPWTSCPAGGRFQELGLESVSLTRFQLEPHAAFDMHEHASAQITLVLGGEMLFVVGDREYRLRAGDSIAIPPGVPHAVRAGDDPVHAVDAWSPPPAHLGD